LLAAAVGLVLVSAPSAVQSFLLSQTAHGSADLPRQFQSFRSTAATGRWAGNLYVPLGGDYTFFQLGPNLSQFYLDGQPLFSVPSGAVAVGFAKLKTGFSKLEIESGVMRRVNSLYWTTPGNAHYKEPIPRLYLASPSVTWQQEAAIDLAHWKWVMWAFVIVAFLFAVIGAEWTSTRIVADARHAAKDP
jgi:hypothetical protein